MHRLNNARKIMMQRRALSSLTNWASVDPFSKSQLVAQNFVNGEWSQSKEKPLAFPDPLDSRNESHLLIPNTSTKEIEPYLNSLAKCPKSGLHNPLKNPER